MHMPHQFCRQAVQIFMNEQEQAAGGGQHKHALGGLDECNSTYRTMRIP